MGFHFYTQKSSEILTCSYIGRKERRSWKCAKIFFSRFDNRGLQFLSKEITLTKTYLKVLFFVVQTFIHNDVKWFYMTFRIDI